MIQPKPKKSTAPKKPVQKKKSNSPVDMYKNMVDPATGKKGTMGGEGTRPPFTLEERKKMPKVGSMGSAKNGKTMMKAKNGKSFPDLNKDGKVTRADILKGRGVIAKKGASVKKAQNGDTLKLKGLSKERMKEMTKIPKNTSVKKIMEKDRAKDIPKKFMKAGGKMTKCKYGCK
jgi:hypothetical protein